MPSIPREILVIKPSSLGDVVHTLPAVTLVKRHWPEARMRWLVNPEWAPLLEGNPFIDEVVIFPRRELRGLKGLLRIPGWAKKMAARKADLVLDFQGLLRSGLIARLAKGGEIVGLSDAREGAGRFYDRTANVSQVSHAVDRYLALVAELGIAIDGPLEWPLPAGSPPAGFTAPERYVLLHPFSRGAGKSLTVEQVREFCAGLAPLPVVIAGKAEVALGDLPSNAIDLLNRTSLHELIWLLRRATFVVSVDSGPMHIAAALTSRLVSIHTWSEPAKVGPYRTGAWALKDGVLTQRPERGQSPVTRPARDFASLIAFVAEQAAV